MLPLSVLRIQCLQKVDDVIFPPHESGRTEFRGLILLTALAQCRLTPHCAVKPVNLKLLNVTVYFRPTVESDSRNCDAFLSAVNLILKGSYCGGGHGHTIPLSEAK